MFSSLQDSNSLHLIPTCLPIIVMLYLQEVLPLAMAVLPPEVVVPIVFECVATVIGLVKLYSYVRRSRNQSEGK